MEPVRIGRAGLQVMNYVIYDYTEKEIKNYFLDRTSVLDLICIISEEMLDLVYEVLVVFICDVAQCERSKCSDCCLFVFVRWKLKHGSDTTDVASKTPATFLVDPSHVLYNEV